MFDYTSVGGMNAKLPVPKHDPSATRRSDEIAALQHDVERLLMIGEALWEILKEHHGYSDEDLMRRVAKIDLKDGKLDGKVAKTAPVQCPRCSRILNKRHALCIYCGEQIVHPPFAR